MRRAGPILAAERGWSARSRAKLRSLADDLHLPPRLYERAIRQLQSGDGPRAADSLTRYELEFVKFLRQVLQREAGQVLAASREREAIEMGERDYQIDAVRARDLVREVASQLGIRRVSRLAAVEHVARLVDQSLGDATAANNDVRRRLVAIAGEWGVDPRQTGILIENRLAASRRPAQRGAPRGIRWFAAVGALLVMAGLVWLVVSRAGLDETDGLASPEENHAAPRNGAVAPPVEFTYPETWSAPTIEAWEQLDSGDALLRLPRHLLLSEDPARRNEGINAVVELALESRAPAADRARSFLIRLAQDDEPAADGVVRSLARRLATPNGDMRPDEGTAPSRKSWESAFVSLDLLREIRDARASEHLRNSIDRILQELVGSSATDRDGAAGFALARRLWGNALAVSAGEPLAVARSFGSLIEVTRHRDEQIDAMILATALAIVKSGDEAWQWMREPLRSLLSSAADDQLFQFVDALSQRDDRDLRDWLTPVIADSLGIKQQDQSLAQLDAAIRRRLGSMNETVSLTASRVALLRDSPDYTAALNEDQAATPQAIANAAVLSTAAFVLWRAEIDHDAALLASFDQLVGSGPPGLAGDRVEPAEWRTLPVYGRISRRPLPTDIEVRRAALETLLESGASPPVLATAFQRLAEVADRFRDVTPEQADALARFMLTASETRERVAVEKYAPQMSHWPTLALAVCERIREEDATLDQSITVASLLTGLEPPIPDDSGNDLHESLRRALLARVAQGLQHTAERYGDDDAFQWDELRRLLGELYGVRCQAVGIPASRYRDARSPGELNRIVAERLAPEDPRRVTTGWLADDEINEAILFGDLLVELVGAQAARDNEPSESPSSRDGNFARAMLVNEQVLLRVLTTQGTER